MREDQIDQAERQAVLENDLRVREQQRGSTFHQHGVSQAAELSGGRFAATGAPTVVASKPNVASQYPAASASHQVSLPPEQPLGYSVNDMPELEPSMATSVTSSVEAQVPGGAAGAPSAPPDVQHPAPPSSSANDNTGR